MKSHIDKVNKEEDGDYLMIKVLETGEPKLVYFMLSKGFRLNHPPATVKDFPNYVKIKRVERVFISLFLEIYPKRKKISKKRFLYYILKSYI